jgi:hypothetical protein
VSNKELHRAIDGFSNSACVWRSCQGSLCHTSWVKLKPEPKGISNGSVEEKCAWTLLQRGDL